MCGPAGKHNVNIKVNITGFRDRIGLSRIAVWTVTNNRVSSLVVITGFRDRERRVPIVARRLPLVAFEQASLYEGDTVLLVCFICLFVCLVFV